MIYMIMSMNIKTNLLRQLNVHCNYICTVKYTVVWFFSQLSSYMYVAYYYVYVFVFWAGGLYYIE